MNVVFLIALALIFLLRSFDAYSVKQQIDQDRSDERLFRPNRRCEITKYQELVWAAKAQTR